MLRPGQQTQPQQLLLQRASVIPQQSATCNGRLGFQHTHGTLHSVNKLLLAAVTPARA